MTENQMKKNLRAMMGAAYKPTSELLISAAIENSVQVVWDAVEWSFRKRTNTLTTTATSQVEMPTDVEGILEMTYGSTNRVLTPIPRYRISEIFNDSDRTGSTMYYYVLEKADADKLTIEFIPNVSGQTVTYQYVAKLTSGDLSQIPVKLHGLVQVGAKSFIESGAVDGSPVFLQMLQRAMLADRPIAHKRWVVGLDGFQSRRIDERNTLRIRSSAQDVEHPYD